MTPHPTLVEAAATGAPSKPLALLSFDVEQFDIPLEHGVQLSRDDQFAVGREGLERVLRVLEPRGVPCTFFITAEFAKHSSDLVQQLVRANTRGLAGQGHEVASHGFTHGPLEPGDLERSREALQEITGCQVKGFRRARLAPTDPEAITRAGYSYNAGENPIWLPGRYNNFFKRRRPYVVQTNAGPLVQIPASASPLIRIPLFWIAFKNLPVPIVRLASRWCLHADGALNTYMHPWEFCDIQAVAIPGYAKRHAGQPLMDRLAGYIDWLQPRAQFATYVQYAQLAAQRPDGRVQLAV